MTNIRRQQVPRGGFRLQQALLLFGLAFLHTNIVLASNIETIGQKVCAFYSEDFEQVQIDDLFAEELLKKIGKENFLAERAQKVDEYGNCKDYKILELNRDAGVFHLSLIFTNNYTSVARMAYTHNQQISQFLFNLNFESHLSPLPSTQRVTMRDGVTLETWLFLNPLDTLKPRPVILERTPYTRVADLDTLNYAATAQWVWSQGYHYVVQAVRGTGRSEGEFELFSPINVMDATDSLDWIDQQSFSNGQVATMGTSYAGFTALATGATNHSTLKLVLAGGAPSNIKTDGFNSNGVLQLVLLDYLRYIQLGQGLPFEPDFQKEAATKLLSISDPSTYDEVMFGSTIREWDRISPYISKPDSFFWNTRSIFELLPSIHVPTYHIAGMALDGDMPDTVRNFRKALSESQKPEAHHLYLGYWDHGNSTPAGKDIGNLGPDLKERLPALLNHHLIGSELPFEDHQIMVASHFQKSLKPWNDLPFKSFPKKELFVDRIESDVVFLSSTKKQKPKLSSQYWYRPSEIHGFTKDQHIILLWQPDEDLAILGELEFNISLSTTAPIMDVMITASKIDSEGNPIFVTNCLFAKRFHTNNQALSLKIDGDCPVFNKVRKNETLQFLITSNMFPQFTRVNTGTGKNIEFKPHEVNINWDRNIPFVSIPVELETQAN